MNYGNGYVTIYLNNGESYKLTTNFDTIQTPDKTEVGEIVVYGSENGKVLGNSNSTIKENINIEESGDDKSVPTIGAVKEYITGVSSVLAERLDGDNAKLPDLDE